MVAASISETEGTGSAYVFEYVDGSWNEINRLLPSDGELSFGHSASLSGGVAIVGASLTAVGQGTAYVFDTVPAECPSCPWDLDESGSVSTGDLLALLSAWGSNPGGPPDFNGDGTVGTSDLLALLSNWGSCP